MSRDKLYWIYIYIQCVGCYRTAWRPYGQPGRNYCRLPRCRRIVDETLLQRRLDRMCTIAQLHIQAIYLHNYCLYWAYMYTTQPLISYLVGGYYTLAIVYIYILVVAVCECKLRILYVQSHRAREHRCIAADIWRVYGEWMRYDNIMCVCSFFHFFFCICRCCICWAGDLQSDVTWHRRCCSTKAGYMSKYMQCTPVRVNKCVGSGNPIASHHNRRVTRWLETIMQQN